MSLICGLDEGCFNYRIRFFSTNLAKFKAAVAAGTGGDMLGLTVRPAITGVDHLKRSLTFTFRNLAL